MSYTTHDFTTVTKSKLQEMDNQLASISNASGSSTNKAHGALAAFTKFSVIGASFEAGVSANGDSRSKSWGKMLERKYGNEFASLAFGGASTKSWLGVTTAANASGYNFDQLKTIGSTLNLVMVTLGGNDVNSGMSSGSVSDCPDEMPDTFATDGTTAYYYGCIILAIKQYAPNAKIICFGKIGSTTDWYAQRYMVIKSVCEKYEVPFVDEYEHAFFNSSDYAIGPNGHPYRITMAFMASGFDELIDDCILENWDYFKSAD